MTKNKAEKLLKLLPNHQGVYLFYDKKKKVIYVGKAASLKNRVRQYFQPKAMMSPAKHSMVKKIEDIKFKETDSEIEALLLESNLIKKYQPEYNVIMKDDKSYVYIKVTTEDEWPTLVKTRNIDASGKYFGPFTAGLAVKETLKLLGKIYPYRKCKMEPGKTCLFGRLGQCSCNGMMGKKEYKEMIKEIIMFFEGKKKKILMDLKRKLRHVETQARRHVGSETGKETGSERVDKIRWKILNLEKVLAHKYILGLDEKIEVDLGELARELSLKTVPERIEGYDISNIYGEQAVGSMVVFQDGRPERSEYRKFKIKTVKGIDDVGSLREVLERRFKHVEAQDFAPVQDKAWPTPDLIIIDGGKGQLNAAQKVLDEHRLKIPVISLAKRLEEVYVPGEIKARVLKRNSPALHLIQRVRDEAHRFAVSYHRLLRRKKLKDG